MTAVDFAAFVERLADVAADTILPFFRTAIGADDKSRGGMFDPVTEADRAAETAMRRLIQNYFPAHGIIGEEFGRHQAEADYVWVLDPIDGTKSFISGLPMWGTLIGLTHKGFPTYGMMVQPFTRERFIGDGGGATWRGPGADQKTIERKLRTRACASPARCDRDDDVTAALCTRQARSLAPCRGEIPAVALRRRLLRLRHARRRSCRLRHRIGPCRPTTSRRWSRSLPVPAAS